MRRLTKNLLGAAAGATVFIGGLLAADKISNKYVSEPYRQIAVIATAIPLVLASGYVMEKVSPRQNSRADNYG